MIRNNFYRLMIATSIFLLAACTPATAVTGTSKDTVNTAASATVSRMTEME